jgi:hypothetical protein
MEVKPDHTSVAHGGAKFHSNEEACYLSKEGGCESQGH